MATDTTALAETLAGTSMRGLLNSAYALTHRIHEATADCGSTNQHRPHGRGYGGREARCEGTKVGAADLRAQRDLIDAEITRRAGE